MRSPALAEQLAHIRAQAHAYRTQAIALDAKLRVLGGNRAGFGGLRAMLLETSARLDIAIWALLR